MSHKRQDDLTNLLNESVFEINNDINFALLTEILKEVFQSLNEYYTGLKIGFSLSTLDQSLILKNQMTNQFTPLKKTIPIQLYGELVGELGLFYDSTEAPVLKAAAQYGELLADLVKEKYYGRQGLRQQNQFEREIDWIFHSSNNLICSIGLDGYFKRIGRLWFYHLGYSEQELFSSPFLEYVEPEDQEITREAIEQIILKGETGHFLNRYRTKWGTIRWLSWSVLPLPSQESLFCLVNDITESKEYEKIVSESERHFRATFNQAAVGITHLDIEGNWIKVNGKFCEIMGYNQEELVYTNFQSLTFPEDIEESANFFNRILLGDTQNPSLEKRYIHKDGSVIWVNVTISMVHPSRHESEYYIAIIQDITEKKRTEAKLKNQTELISNMNVKLLQDLEYAKEIQRAFNTTYLNNSSIICKGQYIPYERIGGDFMGVFEIDQLHTGFYMGDVAGHGVAASFTSIFIHQYIRQNRIPENLDRLFSPKEVLNHLYKVYNQSFFPEEIYFVMLYAVYNRLTRRLTFSSGGLNTYPLLVSPGGEGQRLMGKNPFPIGKFSELFQPEFEDSHMQIEPGAKLFLYTDGLVENHIQPPIHVENLLKDTTANSIGTIHDPFLNIINKKSNQIFDDIAYLLIEFK